MDTDHLTIHIFKWQHKELAEVGSFTNTHNKKGTK